MVASNGTEDLNAIDPGVILAPDGTLWICYGSYHGSIRITQLDPKTGLALRPGELGAPIAAARESEASDIIAHDGYFYLFVNHGSCCKGTESQYNIRVGRARAVTGPYLDQHGEPMAQGAGSLFLAAHDHRIGPGHFGRLLDYDASPNGEEPDGHERFSIHYEADTTRSNRSVLDVRPLLWTQAGWPVAGDHLADGDWQIVSRQSENTFGIYPDPHGPDANGPKPQPGKPTPVPAPRLNRYLARDYERWTISPAVGGLYRIVNKATGEALGLSAGARGGAEGEVSTAPFRGDPGQLWSLDQFPGGGYRIANPATGLALTGGTKGAVIAAPFVRDDLHLWTLTTP